MVGVDGSDGSRRALRWAFEEASFRKLRLRALGVVQLHLVALSVPGYPYADEAYLEGLTSATRELVDDEVSAMAKDFPEVEVQVEAEMGSPAEVLVDASDGAELVVVGSRGRGGFRGLLLGSVSQQVVNHAKVPVLVVRPPRS